ncbi:MAG: AAA family ATPase, partial [Planctomycetia bacterium]
MKVKQICVQKIGPFENTRLDFTQGHPGLHVVYGANETGKSSALRYFNYFFFGIPLKNDENFKHDYQDFLIQAALQASQG